MPYLTSPEVVNARHHDTRSILSVLASLAAHRDTDETDDPEGAVRALVALVRAVDDPSPVNLRKLCVRWLDDAWTGLRPGVLDAPDDVATASGLLRILTHRAWSHAVAPDSVRLVNGIPTASCPACGLGVNLVGDQTRCHTCGASLRWPPVPGEIPASNAPQNAIRAWLEELYDLAEAETDRAVLNNVNHRRAAVAARLAADQAPITPSLVRGVVDAWSGPDSPAPRPNVLSDPNAFNRARDLLARLRPVAAAEDESEVSDS